MHLLDSNVIYLQPQVLEDFGLAHLPMVAWCVWGGALGEEGEVNASVRMVCARVPQDGKKGEKEAERKVMHQRHGGREGSVEGEGAVQRAIAYLMEIRHRVGNSSRVENNYKRAGNGNCNGNACIRSSSN